MAAVSNPASLSSVVSVFGGPGNLTAYYRGGTYVPNTTKNAAIATTPGALALSQFAGASSFSASVSPASQSATVATNTTNATSPVYTCTVVGGTNVTYTWSIVSGTGTLNGTTSSQTSVTAHPGVTGTMTVTIHCVVKDNSGLAITSNQATFTVASTV